MCTSYGLFSWRIEILTNPLTLSSGILHNHTWERVCHGYCRWCRGYPSPGPSGVTGLRLEFMRTPSSWSSHQKSRRLRSQRGTAYATSSFALYLCSIYKADTSHQGQVWIYRPLRAKKWLDGPRWLVAGFYKFGGQMVVFFVSGSWNPEHGKSKSTVTVTHYNFGLKKTILNLE